MAETALQLYSSAVEMQKGNLVIYGSVTPSADSVFPVWFRHPSIQCRLFPDTKSIVLDIVTLKGAKLHLPCS